MDQRVTSVKTNEYADNIHSSSKCFLLNWSSMQNEYDQRMYVCPSIVGINECVEVINL